MSGERVDGVIDAHTLATGRTGIAWRYHEDRLHGGIAGDFNGDGLVDLADFQILIDAVGTEIEIGADAAMADDPMLALGLIGDLNRDGVVDGTDLQLFAGVLEGMGEDGELDARNSPLPPPCVFPCGDLEPSPGDPDNGAGTGEPGGGDGGAGPGSGDFGNGSGGTWWGGGGDPCDPPCDPECEDYDPCHSGCDPECNPDCEEYEPCHTKCGDPKCNPSCDEYDPCDPLCDNYNPCNCFFVTMDTNRDGVVDEADRDTSEVIPGAILISSGQVELPPPETGQTGTPSLMVITSPFPDSGQWRITGVSAFLDPEDQSISVWTDKAMTDRVELNEFQDAPVPAQLWIRSRGVSTRSGDLSLTFEQRTDPEDCYGTLRGTVRMTAVTWSVHDPQTSATVFQGTSSSLEPTAPEEDDSPPTFEYPDLDFGLERSIPYPYGTGEWDQYGNQWGYMTVRHPDTDAPASIGRVVHGAVTDGASLCIIRMRPILHDEDGNLVRVPGLRIKIRKKDDESVTHPSVVGTLTEALRPQDDPWNLANWNNTLPLLPTPYPLPQGADSESEFRDGLAFFVPPEAYADPGYVTGPALNILEECEMEFVVELGDTEIGRRPFRLRRPPIIIVHGLNGGSSQVHGYDGKGYWSPAVYNEAMGSPVPTRLYFADYEATNHLGYPENLGAVASAIQKALSEYRSGSSPANEHHPSRGFNNRRYAIARVDVVGHSMGGQILRLYATNLQSTNPHSGTPNAFQRQGDWPATALRPGNIPDFLRDENYGAGDFRRFIAIGSPFKGSPIANAVNAGLEPTPRNEGLISTAAKENKRFRNSDLGQKMFEGQGKNTVYVNPPTAVADLMVNSTIQQAMENSVLYPQGHRKLVWRPIATVATQPAGNAPIQAVLSEVLITFATLAQFFDGEIAPLNPANSDLVVEQWSQRNALDGNDQPNASIPAYSHHVHTFEGILPPGMYAQTSSNAIANGWADPAHGSELEGIRGYLSMRRGPIGNWKLH